MSPETRYGDAQPRLRGGGDGADKSSMNHPSFRRVAWSGEAQQHFMPAASPVVVGAAMLCGKSLPPFDDVDGDESCDLTEIPMCGGCSRASSKILRRARREFAADVVRDLDALPTTDTPDS
jgi:hypothetical protein